MKPSFHTKLINGPFDDPGLYVRLLREGRALLFDSGFSTNLSTRDILKISDVFISHTHIDHFIGFDHILRLHLRKESPLRLYGPEGFIARIEGKLRSYTWNLLGDYPLVINALEVGEKAIKKATFKAKNFFQIKDEGHIPFSGLLVKDSVFKISAAILDHQVPCLAFSLEEEYHINIDKAKLNELNLLVGPWLRELKMAIREEKPDDTPVTVKGKKFTLRELKGIANVTRGQKLSYVVDAVGSAENIEKIVNLVQGSDTLYIEASFLDKDRDRARQRYHLTAKEAGMIARKAGVGKLVVFHFSPKYINSPEEIVKEAEGEFKGLA